MKHIKPLFVFACLALCGCSIFSRKTPRPETQFHDDGGATPVSLTVTGSLNYFARIAMLPNADAEVFLWDALGNPTSSVPVTVAHAVIRRPGNVPIPFTLTLDPELHNPRHDYYLTARIVIGDTVLFETDTNYPALVRGQTNAVNLILARASDALPDDTTRLPSLR
ncbi:MAG: YbaY family lipoprotein [Kiritimatiellaeota bacterium]|nr:YbaY family lipoprotein [Kiritimatiellota bacterium]